MNKLIDESEVLFLMGLFGESNLQLMLHIEKDESKIIAIKEALRRYEQ